MAKRTAPPNDRANQRAARDENSVINAAVAGTENEIADFAMGDDPLDLDGDTSLEEMGDDLEGEDDIRDAEAATGDEDRLDDGEVDEEEEDDAEVDETEGADEGDDDEAAIAAQDRQQGRGSIPPGRLREESERARAAEAALAERDRQLAELTGRVEALTQVVGRGPAQQQQQPVVDNFPAEPPDPFVDYPGWQAWNVENNRREIARGVREVTQQETNRRLNDSFEAEATGPRSYEFHAAYNALMALPRTSPNDAAKVATKIRTAPDPSAALYTWWEENGAQEFRERIAVDLSERMGWEIPEQPEPRQNGRANGRGEPDRQQQRAAQPQGGERRPVFRGPQRATRSLNDGAGGVRQQIDPRAMDDSDAAVMDYALEP